MSPLKDRFNKWLEGTEDPFLNRIEMQEAVAQDNPEEHYADIDREALKQNVRSMYKTGQGKRRKEPPLFIVLFVVICISFCLILMYGISYLEPVGNADNITNNEVAERYLEKGFEETGAENAVTGMILTYRGFDTFGETTVLFMATCLVMLLLLIRRPKDRDKLVLDRAAREPVDDIILEKVSNMICPIIFMFGVYVVLNGHSSPGGGFAGGVMIGAGLILYAASFGFEKIGKWFNRRIFLIITVACMLLYGAVAVCYFVAGANGFSWPFTPGAPGRLLSGPADICIGTEVACTIYAFYALFRRGGI